MAGNPVGEFLTRCLGNAPTLQAKWTQAVKGARTVLPAPGHESKIYSMIGTGLDRRIRMLFKMDPLPTAVPDPPPWHPLHLCGFPNDDHAERHQFTWWDGVVGPIQSCRTPIDPDLLADIDRLTEMAVETLVPPFASLPHDQRHAHVRTTDMVEMGCVAGEYLLAEPDLICGDTLVEIKSFKRPGPVMPIAHQLARLVLQDRYDRYGIRRVAIYMARQGQLVHIPVFDLFVGVRDLDDLVVLRERYRRVRGEEEEYRLYARFSSTVESRDEFAAVVAGLYYHVDRQVRRDLGIDENPCFPANVGYQFIPPGNLKVAKAALRRFTMTDVADAVRGWRVAERYATYSWASSPLTLKQVLTKRRVRALSELVRNGPASMTS